jgi:hypothetical protein
MRVMIGRTGTDGGGAIAGFLGGKPCHGELGEKSGNPAFCFLLFRRMSAQPHLFSPIPKSSSVKVNKGE